MQPNPQHEPRAWWLFGNLLFPTAMWCLNLALVHFLHPLQYTSASVWLQRGLFASYMWSYYPAVKPWLSNGEVLRYSREWIRFYTFHEDRLWFPVGSLLIALLSLSIPGMLFFATPYTQLWVHHCMIVRRLQIRDILETM